MAWLEAWVKGGALIDAIIVITLIETLALLAYRQQTKRGLAPREFLLNVLSGVSLMLALRFTLSGSAWYFISACLLAAGLAHMADIVWRWQRSTQA